jgi:methionine-gamma-lyase
MMKELKVVHYAVSLGHHRSLVYWMPTADLMATTYRLDDAGQRRYREFAGDGVFRLSVGLEDPADLIADIERALGED